MFRMLPISFFVFVLVANTVIADEPRILPPRLEQLRNQGFEALLNMNYPEARATFEQMIATDPQHPAGHIYTANVIWLGHLAELRRLQTNVYNRGNSFFSKKEDSPDPKVEKAFKSHIEKGINLAQARLDKNKNDISALYLLGIARNINAGFQATVRRSFFSALRNGSKGVDLHRDVLKKNPEMVDARLSVGMYNYVVGSLPLAVKILVFFGGVHGSKKDGIRMLETVVEDGKYARDEAAVLLVMLYNREKRTDDALKLLQYLSSKYPGNSLFRLETAMTLGQLGRYLESFKIYELMIQDQKAYGYMPDLIHYQYAETLFDAGKWDEAVVHYRKATTFSKAPPALVVKAHLNAGYSLDAAGKRNEAVQEYQTVLKLEDMLDSHEEANKRLKKPYRPEKG